MAKRTVEISLNWAITIIAGAILTGLITGAFTVGSILNSDHFALATIQKTVDELPETYARKDVNAEQHKNFNTKLNLLLDHFNIKYSEPTN